MTRRFTMHNRMITEAFYKECSPNIGRFRRGIYLFFTVSGFCCREGLFAQSIPSGKAGLHQPDIFFPCGIFGCPAPQLPCLS